VCVRACVCFIDTVLQVWLIVKKLVMYAPFYHIIFYLHLFCFVIIIIIDTDSGAFLQVKQYLVRSANCDSVAVGFLIFRFRAALAAESGSVNPVRN